MMLALKDAIAQGWLGEVIDFDAWLALGHAVVVCGRS